MAGRDNHLGALRCQGPAEVIDILGLVGQQAARPGDAVQQAGGDADVGDGARRQDEGERSAFSIGHSTCAGRADPGLAGAAAAWRHPAAVPATAQPGGDGGADRLARLWRRPGGDPGRGGAGAAAGLWRRHPGRRAAGQHAGRPPAGAAAGGHPLCRAAGHPLPGLRRLVRHRPGLQGRLRHYLRPVPDAARHRRRAVDQRAAITC